MFLDEQKTGTFQINQRRKNKCKNLKKLN